MARIRIKEKKTDTSRLNMTRKQFFMIFTAGIIGLSAKAAGKDQKESRNELEDSNCNYGNGPYSGKSDIGRN